MPLGRSYVYSFHELHTFLGALLGIVGGEQDAFSTDIMPLVDDHQLIREGLRALLGGVPDLEVVAEVENGHEAIGHAV